MALRVLVIVVLSLLFAAVAAATATTESNYQQRQHEQSVTAWVRACARNPVCAFATRLDPDVAKIALASASAEEGRDASFPTDVVHGVALARSLLTNDRHDDNDDSHFALALVHAALLLNGTAALGCAHPHERVQDVGDGLLRCVCPPHRTCDAASARAASVGCSATTQDTGSQLAIVFFALCLAICLLVLALVIFSALQTAKNVTTPAAAAGSDQTQQRTMRQPPR